MNKEDKNILPDEPNMAIAKMIDLAQECLSVLQAESDRITINDMVKFTVTAVEKEDTFSFYQRAAEEFRPRIAQLSGKVDPSLVTRLQQLQLQIAELAEQNNDRIHRIFPDADRGQK